MYEERSSLCLRAFRVQVELSEGDHTVTRTPYQRADHPRIYTMRDAQDFNEH